MSASPSPWMERARSRARERLASEPPTAQGWIGVDVSGENERHGIRVLLPLLVIALITSLGVAALRIDLIRTRYAVAANADQEQALIETQRALIIRRRQLRDPVELAQEARARGFRAPAHVLVVPDPVLDGLALGAPASSLPAVSSGPSAGVEVGEWQ